MKWLASSVATNSILIWYYYEHEISIDQKTPVLSLNLVLSLLVFTGSMMIVSSKGYENNRLSTIDECIIVNNIISLYREHIISV